MNHVLVEFSEPYVRVGKKVKYSWDSVIILEVIRSDYHPSQSEYLEFRLNAI